MATVTQTLPAALEALILSHIRKTRAELRNAGLTGFVLMVALALGVYFGVSGREHNLWVLCAGAAPLMLLLAIPSLLDPHKAAVLEVLCDRPSDIVWLYERIITGSQSGAYIMCGMKNGKFVQVPCVVGEQGKVLSDLAAYLPHATVGFTPDRDARFRRAPGSFLSA